MFPRRSLVAALALALACVSFTTHAAGLETDPYTLPDGTVVDPTDPNSANRPRDNSNDSIYMPLSDDGPMAGMGPHAHPARGLSQQVGIRSEDDDGFEV